MKKGLIVTIVTLLLLGIGYSAGIGYYAEKFQANTSFGDVDISNLTLEDAQEKIEKHILNSEVTITENGQEIGSISLEELGAQVDMENSLAQSYYSQDPNQWISGFFSSAEYENVLNNHVYVDSFSIQQALNNLGISNVDRTGPQDASIVYKQGQGYVVEEASTGNQLDAELVAEEMIEAIQTGNNTVELNQAYAQPSVTSEDERIDEAMNTIEEITNTTITLQIQNNDVTIPKEKVLEWLYFDNANNPVFDSEAIYDYLGELNDEYASYNSSREFSSTLQGRVSVPAGTLGWSIDRTSETENILDDLQAGKDVTREPAIVGTGYNTNGDDIGSTYVEVDLTYQKMYYYENGQLLLETDIVSGMADADPPTPTIPGAYSIWDKEKDATLVGVNQQRGTDYEQPVSYWLPFDDTGQGIHDANWQGSFGGDVYNYAGSQGCINTPPHVMEQLFNMVSVGTPVIIF